MNLVENGVKCENVKVLCLIPTNSDKHYCLGKFLENLKSIDMFGNVLFSDDTFKGDEYKKTIESAGFEVVKVTKTIDALKVGHKVDIRQCLANTRECLRQEFIKRKEYTHAMWFDSDIIMPKNTIPKLLNHNKDIVSGIYWQNVKRKRDDGSEYLDYHPVVYKYHDDESKKLVLNRYGTTIINEELFPSRLLGMGGDDLSVVAIGTGIMLVGRKLMEDPRWHFRYDATTEGTEDMWFSIDITELGYEIFADSGVCCRHLAKPWKNSIKTKQNQS